MLPCYISVISFNFDKGLQGGLINFAITWTLIYIFERFFHWYDAKDVLFFNISHILMLEKVAR